jgi:hypothetical protein
MAVSFGWRVEARMKWPAHLSMEHFKRSRLNTMMAPAEAGGFMSRVALKWLAPDRRVERFSLEKP